jgi:ubiquinone/menaquinone biosynthesis C-methylase UbiE
MSISPNNKFTQLQQSVYDKHASNWSIENAVEEKADFVGNWKRIKDWAPEEMWKDIPDLHTKDVLDFGCGPGRNLVGLHKKFKSMAGVDISAYNLEKAKEYLEYSGLDTNKFPLYKNDGVSLNGITDDSFDIVMSMITWQHISVYEIRYNLLKEFYRVLRQGGYITIQTLYKSVNEGAVKYHENAYDVPGTNSKNDCVVENPEYINKDLQSIGFSNFKYYIPYPNSPLPSIYFNAQKL